MEQKERLNADFEVKQVRDNMLKGLASTFDVDKEGEQIEPGAFQKTIEERIESGKVKLLDSHNPEKPIGVVQKARETEEGLLIEAKVSEIERAQEIKTLIQEGVLDSLSIGFKAVRDEIASRNGRSIRVIKEVKLLEVSTVAFPANENAEILDVKEVSDQIKKMDKKQRQELIEEIKSFDAEEKNEDDGDQEDESEEENEDDKDESDEEEQDEKDENEEDESSEEDEDDDLEELAMDLDVLEATLRAQE